MFRQHRDNNGKAVGAGILGMAAGFLLGLFISSKKGQEQISKATNWSKDMAEDLNKRVEETRDLTSEKYNSLVDEVSYKYKKLKGIKASEVDDFVDELKMRWDRIKDQWNSQE
jgi:hypothetical protein